MDTKPAQYHTPVDLLIDYADNLLDKETAGQIRRHLNECEVCARTLDGIQHFYNERGADRESLERYLNETRYDIKKRIYRNSNRGILPVRSTVFKAAAIIALTVLAYTVYMYYFGEIDPDSLIAEHLEERYPPPPMTRSGDESIDAQWEKVIGFYTLGDYITAIPLLEEIIASDEEDAAAQFYLALSYLYTQQTLQAAEIFATLSSGQHRFRQQSEWFEGLAYYISGDLSRSSEIFKAIAESPGHYRYSEARTLTRAIAVHYD